MLSAPVLFTLRISPSPLQPKLRSSGSPGAFSRGILPSGFHSLPLLHSEIIGMFTLHRGRGPRRQRGGETCPRLPCDETTAWGGGRSALPKCPQSDACAGSFGTHPATSTEISWWDSVKERHLVVTICLAS